MKTTNADALENQKSVEQIRTSELSYNTTKRLAAAYKNENYHGVNENYATLRAGLESRAKSDDKYAGLARDVLERFDHSIANFVARRSRGRSREAQP